ncbi:DUF998 domain-containing protein [Ruminiclostridium papyrosolvens]|uniref:DUF998 domain-containing protein n=1 Tax=Ruminiclostridium papyrosolvens C7 TaxID=1330534 RepID=U4R172_9FIRM|nr:DUF998 domain-containing protein [Ruminiclostridium papyrosolvens]EPR10523.1 hypothetical protein L323_13090 [Ruminiclostridium papyrosolvens C7]
MKKIDKYLMPLGMVGVLFYFAHTILGNILWKEYNPITTDISSLTADGAPNAQLLKILSFIYGICMVLMVIALIIKSFRQYHIMLRIGYIILIIMQLTSLFGYSLFPLTEDKAEMNFQNTMHIIVTVIVVFTTIASAFLISLGYLKQERMKNLGKLTLVMAVLITIFGMFNPISMSLKLDILGLTERLVIYSIQILMFILSYYYTFLDNKYKGLV